MTDEEKAERKKKLKADMMKITTDMHVLETAEQYEKLEPAKLNTWMVDAGGVHLTVKNPVGEFTATIMDADQGIPNLPKIVEQQFLMKVPKIPAEIYYKIERFFVDVCDRVNNAEAFVQIYFDRETDKYKCFVPKQRVGAASVHYDTNENLNSKYPDRYIFVMDIHSHNTMNAFFSGTDDHDETETRFYGVFGKVKQPIPEFKMRFVVNEAKPEVNVEDVFDFQAGDNAQGYDYPKKWMNQIQNTSRVAPVTRSTFQGHSSRPNRPNNFQSQWTYDDIDFLADNQAGRGSIMGTSQRATSTPSSKWSSGITRKNYADWTRTLPVYLKEFVRDYKLAKGIPVIEKIEKIEEKELVQPIPERLYREEDDFTTLQLAEGFKDLDEYQYKGKGERQQIIMDLCGAFNDEDVETLTEMLCTMGHSDSIIGSLTNTGHLCIFDDELNMATR